MTKYKEINGSNIEVLSSDPANPLTGQIWYNSTSNTLKGLGFNESSAWSTGGNMNSGRYYNAGAGASSSAALSIGYAESPQIIVESYNGSSWTEVGDLNSTPTIRTAIGTQTSALVFGGDPSGALNESWNGSSWTEVGDLNTARYGSGGAGVDNTSALNFGGNPFGGATESWNGSAWTSVPSMNTVRDFLGGSGIQTSALAYGGEGPGGAAQTTSESWNGSSWTATPSLNTGRQGIFSAGNSNTSGLASGGNAPSPSVLTERWNGSSWTEVADMATARYIGGSAGTASSGLNFGGLPGTLTATEEWVGEGPTTVTFNDA